MEISLDIGHRPLVLIRFNPDTYINEKGILVKSPWMHNNRGVSVVKNPAEWDMRLSLLKNQVQYWIDNKTDKTVEIVQLFYDCNILNAKGAAGGAGV